MVVDVQQVFRETVSATIADLDLDCYFSTDPTERATHVAELATRDRARTAKVKASYEVFTIWLRELDVGAHDFDYDDDAVEKAELVRVLTQIACAYLLDLGTIEHRRTKVLRRVQTVYRVPVDANIWLLSSRWHSVGPARP